MPRLNKLSKKEQDALTYISGGDSPRKAMLKAGYAKSSAANPTRALLSKPHVLSTIEQMKLTLTHEGITPSYLASRLAQFAMSDNYQVFNAAYDRITKVIGITPDNQDTQPKKRTVTFTEFINDEIGVSEAPI